jgi:hypothetical protein
MQLPDEIQDLCETFLAGLHGILDDKLYGVYLYGALAFADGGPISDVDFHCERIAKSRRGEARGPT